MKILTRVEGQQWFAAKHSHPLFEVGYPFSFGAYSVRYRTPESAVHRRILAARLVDFLAEMEDSSLWIYDCEDWSWPGSENLELFHGYRKSLNESRNSQNKEPGKGVLQAAGLPRFAVHEKGLQVFWQALIANDSPLAFAFLSSDFFATLRQKFLASPPALPGAPEHRTALTLPALTPGPRLTACG